MILLQFGCTPAPGGVEFLAPWSLATNFTVATALYGNSHSIPLPILWLEKKCRRVKEPLHRAPAPTHFRESGNRQGEVSILARQKEGAVSLDFGNLTMTREFHKAAVLDQN